jgi:hypothetical protein
MEGTLHAFPSRCRCSQNVFFIDFLSQMLSGTVEVVDLAQFRVDGAIAQPKVSRLVISGSLRFPYTSMVAGFPHGAVSANVADCVDFALFEATRSLAIGIRMPAWVHGIECCNKAVKCRARCAGFQNDDSTAVRDRPLAILLLQPASLNRRVFR